MTPSTRKFSPESAQLFTVINSDTCTPEDVRRHVRAGADVCFQRTATSDTTLHRLARWDRWDCVFACLETPLPIDFTLRYSHGSSILSALLPHVEIERDHDLLLRLAERWGSAGNADIVDWLEEDDFGWNVFTAAAWCERLHHLWSAVVGRPSFMTELAGRRIPIRVDVAEADWTSMSREDQQHFELDTNPPSAATIQLYNTIYSDSCTRDVVLRHVRGGADVCFRPTEDIDTIIHQLADLEKWDCVRACLESSLPIDFTLRNGQCLSLLGLLMVQLREEHDLDLVLRLAERWGSAGNADIVDWLEEDDFGWNVFTAAAWCERLHDVWSAVVGRPSFMTELAGRRIPIRVDVAEADWTSMSQEDQKHFELDGNRPSAETLRLYELISSCICTPDLVRGYVRRGADVCFRPSARDGTIIHQLARVDKWDCVCACLETPLPIDFTLSDWGDSSILSGITVHLRVERDQPLLLSLVERWGSAGDADIVDWLEEDDFGWNVFTAAAWYGRLHHLWSAVQELLSIQMQLVDRRIPIRVNVADADWSAVCPADHHHFELGINRPSRATIRLHEHISASYSYTPEDVRRHVCAGADVCFRPTTTSNTIIHRMARDRQWDCVCACLETPLPIDFTLRHGQGFSLLGLLTVHLREEHDHDLLLRLAERWGSAGNADIVDWLEEDNFGWNAFTAAAWCERLHHLWSAVVGRPSFMTELAGRRIPIRVDVAEADWTSMSREDQQHFELDANRPSAATIQLYNTIYSDSCTRDVVLRHVRAGADVCFCPTVARDTIIHQLALLCRWDCVRACLETPRPIDFSARGWSGGTLLIDMWKRSTVAVVDDDARKDMLRFLWIRLANERSGSPEDKYLDKVDWEARDLDGWHVLAHAAASGVLLEAWKLVKGSVANDVNTMKDVVEIFTAVLRDEWAALTPHQHYFELCAGLQDETWELYYEVKKDGEANYERVVALLLSPGVVSLCAKRDYMVDPILHTVIRRTQLDVLKLCLQSDHAIDFTSRDSNGNTPFHLVCSVRERFRAEMLEVLMNRVNEQRSKDIRPSWTTENHYSDDVLSHAARWRCLHVMWEAIKPRIRRRATFALRSSVFDEDWKLISAEDQVRFTNQTVIHTESRDVTDELYESIGDAAACRYLMERGANPTVRRSYMMYSPLHAVFRACESTSWGDCPDLVRILMCCGSPLDFTVTDPHQQTPLHYVCALERIVEEVLRAIVNRLRSHPEDKVDWFQKDDLDNDFLSYAARHHVLHQVWPFVRDLEAFRDRTEKIRITTPVLHSDWEQLIKAYPADEDLFLLEKKIRKRPGSVEEAFKEYRLSSIERVTWRKLKKLGKGGVGSVFAGELPDGSLVAVKQVSQTEGGRDQNGGQRKVRPESEAEFLQKLKHKNVIQCYGYQYATMGNRVEIFLEFCPHSLEGLLQDSPEVFTMGVVRKYARQILQGLAYLHDQRILHRDVKPGNVLVSAERVAKLADFDVSLVLAKSTRHADECKLSGTEETARDDISEDLENSVGKQTTVTGSDSSPVLAKTHCCGTPEFMAPEVMIASDKNPYSYPADIWSTGCTVLKMLGLKPWSGANEPPTVCEKMSAEGAGMPTGVPPRKECPPALYTFFERCFARDVNARWTAQQLLDEDVWLNCPLEALEPLRLR